jgi:hypothetical protein
MGSKEPEPWSPWWVRQKLREKNNDLIPNDPNYDEKPPTDAERPFMHMRLRLSISHEFRPRYIQHEVLVLPSVHLSVPLGLGRREATKDSSGSNIYIVYS